MRWKIFDRLCSLEGDDHSGLSPGALGFEFAEDCFEPLLDASLSACWFLSASYANHTGFWLGHVLFSIGLSFKVLADSQNTVNFSFNIVNIFVLQHAA